MEDWNSVYEKKGVFQKQPSEKVIRAVSLFKQKGLSRVLDLGCGTGRHTRYLLEEGFDVYGCDSSEEALAIIRQRIPEAVFDCCDMTSLTYKDAFFEGIICNHVIQHGLKADAEKAAAEMQRVLAHRGYLFLIAASTSHPKYATGREIEPNTRIDTVALDGHVPHHFFTRQEMEKLFEDFDIISLEHFEGPSELDETTGSAAWELYARNP
jgi:ubiquinone/menaquinone biosynthesis C-methylase UbiE